MEGGLHLTHSCPKGREGRWPECQALPPRASSHQLPVSAGATGIQGDASWWVRLDCGREGIVLGAPPDDQFQTQYTPFPLLPLDLLIFIACELSFIDCRNQYYSSGSPPLVLQW